MSSTSPVKSQDAYSGSGKNLEEKIRSLMRRKDDVIGKTKLTQKLEFGHIHAAAYNNHSSNVKGIIWNPNLNWFASYDEK